MKTINKDASLNSKCISRNMKVDIASAYRLSKSSTHERIHYARVTADLHTIFITRLRSKTNMQWNRFAAHLPDFYKAMWYSERWYPPLETRRVNKWSDRAKMLPVDVGN